MPSSLATSGWLAAERLRSSPQLRNTLSVSYFSELVFWVGFAMFTWSPAGLYILAISAANLVPRARYTHKWYRERLPDYPAERKALIPFVW